MKFAYVIALLLPLSAIAQTAQKQDPMIEALSARVMRLTGESANFESQIVDLKHQVETDKMTIADLQKQLADAKTPKPLAENKEPPKP